VVISKHQRGLSALKDLALLEQVVAHKQHFFREAAAHYELAKKGALRLAPSQQLQDALRKDYEKMREMYFGQEPDFDAVMSEILELEDAFNKRK
jgi:Nucleotidyl transferase AbiEii toxin, Type IV TA system